MNETGIVREAGGRVRSWSMERRDTFQTAASMLERLQTEYVWGGVECSSLHST